MNIYTASFGMDRVLLARLLMSSEYFWDTVSTRLHIVEHSNAISQADRGRCAMLRFSVKAEWNVAADVWEIAFQWCTFGPL